MTMISGKTILLTGGTSGIGAELVGLLQAENELIIVGRDAGRLKQAKSKFPGLKTHRGDLSKPQAGIKLGAKIAASVDKLDMLIHNAAIQNEPKLTDDDFDAAAIAGEVNANFTSVIELTHALLPVLMRSDKAVICNINSGLALAPKTGSAVYCATKGGLNVFSQSLAYQLEGSSVGVTQVFLPLVDTPMTEGRGSGKISAAKAASDIVAGLGADRRTINVGKVKLLRIIMAVAPFIARRILKSS